MLKNLSDFLRPFSPSTLLFSINNSTKHLKTHVNKEKSTVQCNQDQTAKC